MINNLGVHLGGKKKMEKDLLIKIDSVLAYMHILPAASLLNYMKMWEEISSKNSLLDSNTNQDKLLNRQIRGPTGIFITTLQITSRNSRIRFSRRVPPPRVLRTSNQSPSNKVKQISITSIKFIKINSNAGRFHRRIPEEPCKLKQINIFHMKFIRKI